MQRTEEGACELSDGAAEVGRLARRLVAPGRTRCGLSLLFEATVQV